jgi:hypothetical protein
MILLLHVELLNLLVPYKTSKIYVVAMHVTKIKLFISTYIN